MNTNFADLLNKYRGIRVAVAVSGGADSMALLHMASVAKLDAVALTVDHGLRDDSGRDAAMVERFAAKIGIRATILRWSGRKPKTGIEAAARDARYKLMADFCRVHGIGVLLTAHQADDQIETFLLNLGRGSGIYGLAAMRPETTRDGITIARPLLSVSRAELIIYCKKNKIKYATDAMNDDMDFARVRIRKNRHLLSDKLGITDARLLTAIDALGRVRAALEDDINKMIDIICPPTDARDAMLAHVDSPQGGSNFREQTTPPLGGVAEPTLVGDAVGGQKRVIFSAKFLFDMPTELQMKFLSRLFQKIGNIPYPPRLEKVQRAIILLNNDCKFTNAHCIVRRLGDKILVAPEGTSCAFKMNGKSK